MNKLTLSIIIIALVLGGVFAWLQIDNDNDAALEVSPSPSESPAKQEPKFSWEFERVGEDSETGAPKTKVSLVVDGAEAKEVGTYDGACLTILETNWQIFENEISAAICWWAGGGKEIGVFSENGKYVVKVGDLDEGSDETPGFRGNFMTVVEY